jgi:hypothetical protein
VSLLDELRAAARSGDGLALGDRSPEERVIDAALLRSLCLELDQVDPRGLAISGARVAGTLDLGGTELGFWLGFYDTVFDDPIVLVSARLASLTFQACALAELVASRLTVGSELDLTGSTVCGSVSLMLARLGGLLCRDATLGSESDGSSDALKLDWAQVEGFVQLTRTAATGGVSLSGARIGGAVNCDGARIEAPGDTALALNGAEIGGDVDLGRGFHCIGDVRGLDARIRGSLALQNGTVDGTDDRAVTFDRASIDGDLALRGLVASGSVSFDVARIGCRVFCDAAKLEARSDFALSFRRAEIGDMIVLGQDFQTRGPVIVSGARIGGDLNCQGATIKSGFQPNALEAVGTEVGGGAVLTDLVAVGQVLFMDCRVGGSFNAMNAQLANLPDPALDLVGVRIGGSVVLDGLEAKGPVQIRGTRVGCDIAINGASLAAPGRPAALYLYETQIDGDLTLRDVHADGLGVLATRAASLDDDLGRPGEELGSWHCEAGTLRLDGFAYDAFSWRARDADADTRIRWLRSTLTYEPRSWLQLAATLRAQGRDGDATRVLVAMQNDRLRRGGLSPLARVGRQILRLTIGYGYRPWLAGVWAALVITTYALVVWQTPEQFAATATSAVGSPQPLIYAADTFLPVIDFGQAGDWAATGWAAWIGWAVILIGWALTTIFVAGFTRLVRSA